MTDQRTLAILVVDDDQECRDTYVDMCTRLGHSVTAVASGYQAEAQSAKESFDVVLLRKP
jgi:CheY-like chemotaxis protein